MLHLLTLFDSGFFDVIKMCRYNKTDMIRGQQVNDGRYLTNTLLQLERYTCYLYCNYFVYYRYWLSREFWPLNYCCCEPWKVPHLFIQQLWQNFEQFLAVLHAVWLAIAIIILSVCLWRCAL